MINILCKDRSIFLGNVNVLVWDSLSRDEDDISGMGPTVWIWNHYVQHDSANIELGTRLSYLLPHVEVL